MDASTFMPLGPAFGAMSETCRSRLLMGLESRAPLEMASLSLALPTLVHLVPRGDGHPVLVVPGLLAGDETTAPLRFFLLGQGYAVHGWGQGPNMGPREGVIETLQGTLAHMQARQQRKVSIIGWSLGGIYAREIARAAPHLVRQVITLGSPLYGDSGTGSVSEIYHRVSGLPRGGHDMRGREAPPVPTTSIYSRTDGVVGWGCSVERHGPATDNIEINSASHTGLGVNPLVWYAIGDRLAQPEDAWAHFEPRGLARLLFPTLSPRR
jgi:pimeloyl-ACP methyl ester carboxylesterase